MFLTDGPKDPLITVPSHKIEIFKQPSHFLAVCAVGLHTIPWAQKGLNITDQVNDSVCAVSCVRSSVSDCRLGFAIQTKCLFTQK